MRYFDIQKLSLPPPQPVPTSSPILPERGPKINILHPTTFLPRPPIFVKLQHNLPITKPWEKIDLAQNPRFGVGA